MEFTGMLRRVAGVGAALAVASTMLIAPGAASAAPPWINIKHANSPHNCLDANDRGEVYTHTCNGGEFQMWRNYSAGGWGKFEHKRRPGQCLGASTGAVFVTACSSEATDWKSDAGNPKYIWNRNGKYLNNAGGDGEAVGLRVGRTGTSRWLTVNT